MDHPVINSLVETVAATETPITISEAKKQICLEIGDDDVLIGTMIEAVTKMAEVELNRSFVDTTWEMKLDKFPRGHHRKNRVIRPTRSPLSSVTSITYIDDDGVSQTLATTEYSVDTAREPGRITEAFDKTWPDTRDIPNAVTITFVAGYGDKENVPENIKAASKLLFADQYENREASTPLRLQELPAVQNLLSISAVPDIV